jgi:DNA polymerase V
VQRLALELRGEPCQSLTLAPPDNKTILASRSFGRVVTDRREIEESVCSHIARAAEKLRRHNLVAGLVMVFVTTNPFRPQDKQYQASKTIGLPVASADTITLTRAALIAAKAVFREGYRYKKAGITLVELSTADRVQGDMWTSPDTPRSKTLMAAIDTINRSHGREAIKLAGSGIERGWKLRSGQRSAHFTTDWDELLCVGE